MGKSWRPVYLCERFGVGNLLVRLLGVVLLRLKCGVRHRESLVVRLCSDLRSAVAESVGVEGGIEAQ
jgi:hypothetical protein